MKFVIVIFDGLRTHDVCRRLMPNLFALRQEGTWLSRHVAGFPSETRVSAAALSSGSYCGRHGIVGNHFLDRSGPATTLVNGSDLNALLGLGQGLQARALTTKALGEILAEAGHRMLSVGAQSSGSWGLTHWNGWSRGEFAYWCPDPLRHSDQASVVAQARARASLPEAEKPAIRATTCLADVFLEAVRADGLPTVSLLWFSEPDVSQHAFGLAAPEAEEALRHADRQFGRILDWWSQARRSEEIQLIVGSDHGQLTIGEKVSVADTLRDAGFTVGAGFTTACDIALSSQRVANLWVRDGDPGLARAAFECLAEQAWCGPSFSPSDELGDATIPGTFAYDVVFANHRRRPDLAVVLADLEDDGDAPSPARVYCDGRYPVGAGMHGGLNREELTAVGLCAGSYFRERHVSALPSSIVDLAPTVLFGLGLSGWQGMDGRVLFETMDAPPAAWHLASPEPYTISSTPAGRIGFAIEGVKLGSHAYVEGARRSKAKAMTELEMSQSFE